MTEYSDLHVMVPKLCCRVIPVFRELPSGFPPLKLSDGGLIQVHKIHIHIYIYNVMYIYVHKFLISYIAKSLHPVGSAVILRPHVFLFQMEQQYSLNHFSCRSVERTITSRCSVKGITTARCHAKSINSGKFYVGC